MSAYVSNSAPNTVNNQPLPTDAAATANSTTAVGASESNPTTVIDKASPSTTAATSLPSKPNTAASDVPSKPNDTNNTPTPTPEQPKPSAIATIASSVFTQSNLLILGAFLGAYLLLYVVLGKFFGRGQEPSSFNLTISRSLDILFFVLFGIIAYVIYETYKSDEKKNVFTDASTKITDYISDPMSTFTTGLFLVIFYFVIYLFRIPNERDTKPFFVSIIENIAWILLVISLFVDFFTYTLGVSFYELFPFLDFFKKTPLPSDLVAPVFETKEVFNISNNIYTYDEAQAVCKIFDADVATYSQVEAAYNKGGEWCNYGWSEGQMALFPTQLETWEKLQKDDANRSSDAPSVKNNCGRPGINGGYMENPYLRFGVNCYGKKPTMSESDIARMTAAKQTIVPKTPTDQVLEKKVEYWKQHKDKMLNLNAFNADKWSKHENTIK